MTPGNLFTILLKMTGIFLLKDIIIALSSAVPMLIDFFSGSGDFYFIALLIPVSVIAMYAFLIYLLIFRTAWIIDKLKLTGDFTDAPFTFNIHRSTVLSISFIVVGLLTLVNTVPFLVKEIIELLQQKKRGGILNMAGPFDSSYLFVYAAEIILAILLIVYQATLVNFIESRRKK